MTNGHTQQAFSASNAGSPTITLNNVTIQTDSPEDFISRLEMMVRRGATI